ncbi:hypothetical protein SASPL_109896 [Salvia splendens]|uniref:Uncharacterized protein n=1 Tax=Salvia splendens TaxID=180675 RepID=A0A8X8YG08_SALSN|nr:hypothetical protein SASPL_109896 [Salvia splendens]
MLQQLADLSQQSSATRTTSSPTVADLAYSRGARDVVFSPPDSSWRTMRKVLVRETQSTSGLDASRELRRDQIRKAVRSIYDNIGRPVAFGQLVFQTEVSLLMSLMWGGVERDRETERLGAEFRAINSEISHLLGKPNVSDLFPVLSRLDLQGVERQMEKVVDSLDKILGKVHLSAREAWKDFLHIVLDQKDSDLPTLSRD